LRLSTFEYITEIFARHNSLNGSMQDRNENYLTSSDKFVAFAKNMLYEEQSEGRYFGHVSMSM